MFESVLDPYPVLCENWSSFIVDLYKYYLWRDSRTRNICATNRQESVLVLCFRALFFSSTGTCLHVDFHLLLSDLALLMPWFGIPSKFSILKRNATMAVPMECGLTVTQVCKIFLSLCVQKICTNLDLSCISILIASYLQVAQTGGLFCWKAASTVSIPIHAQIDCVAYQTELALFVHPPFLWMEKDFYQQYQRKTHTGKMQTKFISITAPLISGWELVKQTRVKY